MASVGFTQGRHRGALSATLSGRSVGIKIDASRLDDLAYGLGDLRESLADRLIRSSFKDGLRGATPEAKRRTVYRGGFDLTKPNLSGRVKRGINGRMTGVMQAEIKSINTWPSLRYWLGKIEPRGNYTTRSFRNYPARGPGVTARGLFRHNVAFTDKRFGFPRPLANGNVHLIGGEGSGWHPDGTPWKRGDKTNAKVSSVMHGPNASHLMLHDAVSKPVQAKFYSVMDSRFVSKYEGALAKIAKAHGL